MGEYTHIYEYPSTKNEEKKKCCAGRHRHNHPGFATVPPPFWLFIWWHLGMISQALEPKPCTEDLWWPVRNSSSPLRMQQGRGSAGTGAQPQLLLHPPWCQTPSSTCTPSSGWPEMISDNPEPLPESQLPAPSSILCKQCTDNIPEAPSLTFPSWSSLCAQL